MAAKCSGIPGAVCINNVLFRVHKDAIETDTGRIDCDLSAALGELGTVLPADAQVTRTLADLEIFSLCDDCWTKLDAKWGKGVYMPIPARAIVDGMFFHTSMPDLGRLRDPLHRRAGGVGLPHSTGPGHRQTKCKGQDRGQVLQAGR